MLEKKTYADCVYEKIKDDIIYLRLQPGKKISEALLAEKYNISRNPVRNALGRLEGDGLVTIKPQQGTFISEISLKRGLDICDVRLILETYAIRFTAPKISSDQIEMLQVLFDTLESIDPESEDRSRFVSEVDIKLHNMIYDICGNEIIPAIIKSYSVEIQRLRRATINVVDRKKQTQKEMQNIFQALKLRDVEAAVQAMTEHIMNIKKAISTLASEDSAVIATASKG